MFETDPLSELKFVLEFNLPKEISNNQEYIKLSVHHVDVPVVEIPECTIGYKSIPFKSSGELHCIERYEDIKDILPLVNRWVNNVWIACSKSHSSRNNLLVEAKLYAYKNDNSLFKKWSLEEFYPLFNTNAEYFSDDVVELIFKFKNIAEVDDISMYDTSKYIKEYKDRNNKCKFCAYYPMIQGSRCYMCEDHDWFVHEISLKQYIIKRVTEDSEKEFKESDEAIRLKTKVDLRKNVYDDFNKYVEKQKEIFDKELEDKHAGWSSLNSEYNNKMAVYVKDSVSKALESLNSTAR